MEYVIAKHQAPYRTQFSACLPDFWNEERGMNSLVEQSSFFSVNVCVCVDWN